MKPEGRSTVKRILSVGHMQFPLGQAQVQRQLLMAKAIMLEGYAVTVLCRYGIHSESDKIEKEGFFEGVHYVYCSGTSVRPAGLIRRNMLKIKGVFNEIRYYRKYSKIKELEGALVSTNRFFNIVFYYLIGRIFNTVTVVDNVEYWTSNYNIRGWKRLDKFFYDRFYYLFADKIICISDFLIRKVGKSKKSDIIKIPAITDFEKFKINSSPRLVTHDYFLFCGSKAYFEILDFIIRSFELLESHDISMVLVTEQTEKLSGRIGGSNKKNQITVMSNIPYSDLVNLYSHSKALLIPMRETDQDKARFPHKISEYCAAARPIITNRVGEISNYFNESNSYLSPAYDSSEFTACMKKIISEPREAELVARNSYQTGLENFNYKSYSRLLIGLFNHK
ncbi:MAG: glycosyltransferase [Bacteroidota bacterium]|nr:glycosyltransferase [Bacteroidota bacterium]